MLTPTYMNDAIIELTGPAAQRWRGLTQQCQKELVDEFQKIMLTMPLESVEPPAPPCQNNEPNSKNCSRVGSIKSSTKLHSVLPVITACLLLIISLALSSVTLAQSQVDNRLLEAVLQVESSGRHTARGDLNKTTGEHRALGGYQFWRPTWNHVSQIRQRAGLQTISYDQGATHPAWSREYARSYLTWIENYIRGRGVNTPTRSQIYAGYNWGVGSFRKVGFDVSKAPATTQRACRKIEALCR